MHYTFSQFWLSFIQLLAVSCVRINWRFWNSRKYIIGERPLHAISKTCSLSFFYLSSRLIIRPNIYLIHLFMIYLPDYAFPYLSIIISMISNAAHFSMKLDQSIRALFLSSITETKNCIIIGNLDYRANYRWIIFRLSFNWLISESKSILFFSFQLDIG